jgi:N-acetylglucosamine-6-sulfatase
LAALVAIGLGCAGALTAGAGGGKGAAVPAPRPNFVFLLTDDQTASEMRALPRTRRLLGRRGVTFTRNYVSFPLCCPSRVSLLTGRYMHNHGVRGNRGATGGLAGFRAVDGEAETLPVWLQRDGYYTAMFGKYLNGYLTGHPPEPRDLPPGWDEWHGKTSHFDLRSPGGRIYYDYGLYEAGPDRPPHLTRYGASPRDYETDVLRRKAVSLVGRMAAAGSPFYMAVNFSAPHAPFVPARRDRGRFRHLRLPRLAAFDERDISDKPRFLRRQARRPLARSQVREMRRARRRQYEQLRSVDAAVAAIVRALRRGGLLRDTYLVFSSDNGTFWGEHRIAEGKYLPYDPATRVPLIVRGPGVPRGRRSRELVANVDYAPTILDLAGASAPAGFELDGRSLRPFLDRPGRRSRRRILLEGEGGPSFKPVTDLDQEPIAQSATPNVTHAPAYRAVRTSRYLYVRWASGAVELYDMKRDPEQLHSLQRSRRYRRVRRRLETTLAALARCRGETCRVGAAAGRPG